MDTGLILIVPFDITVNTQGMLKPEYSFNFIPHIPVQIISTPQKIGTTLRAGEILMKLNSPDLDQKIQLTTARIDFLIKQIGSAGFLSETKAQQSILREQLTNAQNELKGQFGEKNRLSPIAQFDGQIADVQQDIHPGDSIPRGLSLLTFINPQSWVVDCYVEESDLERIAIGNWGRFIPDTPGLPARSLQVITIDKDRSRTLTDPQLASTAGGHILVRQQKEAVIPERVIYKVRLKVEGDPLKISTGNLRGSVVIYGWPRSILGELLRGGLGTFIREAGF